MKRSQWGLTDIERRMADEQRRLRNVVRAIVVLVLALNLLDYLTR